MAQKDRLSSEKVSRSSADTIINIGQEIICTSPAGPSMATLPSGPQYSHDDHHMESMLAKGEQADRVPLATAAPAATWTTGSKSVLPCADKIGIRQVDFVIRELLQRPRFPPGPPEDHYPYLIPNTDLGIEFHPLGLIPHRNEALVKKVLMDSIHDSLGYRVSAKMPGQGYWMQEGGFLLSVGHSTGASEFTWGMWTIVLTGLNEWAEEELAGKVIGAGFAKMR
ncbi:MAG: hypothetical protein Q9180_005459 [Flavoplaca navasiana]